jgi:hypothetical protein
MPISASATESRRNFITVLDPLMLFRVLQLWLAYYNAGRLASSFLPDSCSFFLRLALTEGSQY